MSYIFTISFPVSTVDRLWSITEDLNILYKENWTRLAAQEVQLFQVSLLLLSHSFSFIFLALFLIDFTHSSPSVSVSSHRIRCCVRCANRRFINLGACK